MNTLLTPELIERCHAGSKAKGFWPEGSPPPQGQQLMLVVSELAEALEAHRKSLVADFPLYHESLERVALLVPEQHKEEAWARAFVACLKDSVGDELADAYIRLCDFAGGFKASRIRLVEQYEYYRGDGIMPEGNFGSDLLYITGLVLDIDKYKDSKLMADKIASALAMIDSTAEYYEIDLDTHISLKLRYNATRPDKHNKLY